MKKRIIGTVLAVTLSLLLSAAISLGTLYYVRNRNVEETGNILGVTWYNEKDTEFTISTNFCAELIFLCQYLWCVL